MKKALICRGSFDDLSIPVLANESYSTDIVSKMNSEKDDRLALEFLIFKVVNKREESNILFIRFAQAYKNWLKKNGEESWRLPGINFTSEQLFYVGFGQVMRMQFVINFVSPNSCHSPALKPSSLLLKFIR